MFNEDLKLNPETNNHLNPLSDLRSILEKKILTPQQEQKIHGELLKMGENLFLKEDLKKLIYLVGSFQKLSETTL